MATKDKEERYILGDWPALKLVKAYSSLVYKPLTPHTWIDVLDTSIGQIQYYDRPPRLTNYGEIAKKFDRYVTALQDPTQEPRQKIAEAVREIVSSTVLPDDLTPSAQLARLVVGSYVYTEFRDDVSVEDTAVRLERLAVDMNEMVDSRNWRRSQARAEHMDDGTSILGHIIVNGFKIEFSPRVPLAQRILAPLRRLKAPSTDDANK